MKSILRFIKNIVPAVKKYGVLILKSPIKLFSIKTLIILAVVVGIAALIYLGLGGGIGGGKGDGEGDGNTNNPDVKQEEVQEDNKEGNEDDYKGAIFSVTVTGNDYFFQNERVQLEDLIDTLNEVEGNFVVEIKDDYASFKALNTLIDRLENSHIRYIEK